jgi:hypothetical protein
MFINYSRLVCLLGATICLSACDKLSSPQTEKVLSPQKSKNNSTDINEVNKMNEPTIQDPYDLVDIDSTPSKVPFSAELNQYLVVVMQSMIMVIKDKSDVKKTEPVLGEGEYHWPKDKKPITLRVYKKLKTKRFSVVFERKNEDLPWFEGTLNAFPRNYPRSVYSMDLPASLFADFKLDKAFKEDRPEQSLKSVNVFQFHLKNSTTPVQLQFEAREDVSNLEDKYPKSFHFLKITRIGE